MKITAIETVSHARFPNLLWVSRAHRRGNHRIGRGPFTGPGLQRCHIHSYAAKLLLEEDPLQIDRHSKAVDDLHRSLGGGRVRGTGRVQSAGNSALGRGALGYLGAGDRAADLPAPGRGRSRDSIRVVQHLRRAHQYVRTHSKQVHPTRFNLPGDQPEGPYEDLQAFLTDAGALAKSLQEMGITGMKIWALRLCGGSSSGRTLHLACRPGARSRTVPEDP